VKIAMLSDHETLGGAAQAASRLAESLGRAHDVIRLVLFPDGRRHPWHTYLLGSESGLARWLQRIPRKLVPTHFPRPGTPAFAAQQLDVILRRLRPDVVNIHNLHGGAAQGWTPDLAAVCAAHAPVVWTLHDMWSFTGRCAYAYDCAKFATGCDATCPTPNEPPALAPERIAAAWEARRRLFAAHAGLVGVTPSRWLAAEARRGMWAGHQIEVIPYGVPADVFALMPRDEARRRLGVPNDRPVLVLAAYDLSERRKGATLLPRIWRHVGSRPLTVLTMGHGRPEIADSDIRVQALGWLDDDAAKMLAYNAADFLLHPAPVDNFPNVVLEALACGTPAIGLPVGGVPELIRSGVSGWIATDASADALGRAIDQALDSGADLRASCRAIAEREFAMARQADSYVRLFDEMIRLKPFARESGLEPR
jgi:glycosyltransferase involved in cell wall biosynthesis